MEEPLESGDTTTLSNAMSEYRALAAERHRQHMFRKMREYRDEAVKREEQRHARDNTPDNRFHYNLTPRQARMVQKRIRQTVFPITGNNVLHESQDQFCFMDHGGSPQVCSVLLTSPEVAAGIAPFPCRKTDGSITGTLIRFWTRYINCCMDERRTMRHEQMLSFDKTSIKDRGDDHGGNGGTALVDKPRHMDVEQTLTRVLQHAPCPVLRPPAHQVLHHSPVSPPPPSPPSNIVTGGSIADALSGGSSSSSNDNMTLMRLNEDRARRNEARAAAEVGVGMLAGAMGYSGAFPGSARMQREANVPRITRRRLDLFRKAIFDELREQTGSVSTMTFTDNEITAMYTNHNGDAKSVVDEMLS